MMDSYIETLRDLRAFGLEFACIGTFGLAMHEALPPGYALLDADIVANPDDPKLISSVSLLQQAGWQLFLWDDPIDAPPNAEVLIEKFYLRARKATLCLDLTVAGLALSIRDILNRAQLIDGIPVATVCDIAALKSSRNSPSDASVLRYLAHNER